jgi:hypothetical protein
MPSLPLDVDRLLDMRLSSPCTGTPCWAVPGEQNSAGLSPQIEEAIRTIVTLRARIESPKALRDFLWENPDLLVALRHACAEVAVREWSERVETHVYIISDSESDSRYVAVYVRTRSYSGAFLDELRLLSSELDALEPRQSDRFLVSTDFRQPLG